MRVAGDSETKALIKHTAGSQSSTEGFRTAAGVWEDNDPGASPRKSIPNVRKNTHSAS